MIMAVVTPLATVFFMFILHVHLVTSEVHGEVFAQQPGTSGVLFTEHILFSSQEVAKSTCASMCLQTALCLSFTFTGVMQPGKCQGYSEIMVFSCANITEAGAQTYAVREKEEWLQKSCSIDADCKTSANVKCRKNTCVCTPGYFYSESLNQCVSDCPISSLTSSFVLYDQANIASHNIATGHYVDADSCKEACVQTASCLSAEWYNKQHHYMFP